jgi:1-acyl-sn-glycerol-3-phosphate acyltransferase
MLRLMSADVVANTTGRPPGAGPSGPLWRNRSFTLMWASVAASGFGDRMIMVAALALLGAMAGDAASTGLNAQIQFFFFLPYILFSVVAGWLADHLPRKWLMLTCDELRGGLLLLAVVLLAANTGPAAIPQDRWWQVFLILFGVGTLASIFNPTRNATIPQIVRLDQLQAANAVVLILGVIASLIGLKLGTELIDPDSAQTLRQGLLIAAVLYLASGLFFAFLKIHKHKRDTPANAPGTAARAARPKRSVRQGVAFMLGHRRLLVTLALNILVWGAAAVFYAGSLGVAKTLFGLTDKPLLDYYGTLGLVLGLGMLIGAGLIALINTQREASQLMMWAAMLAGVCLAITATVPVMGVHLTAAFGLGLFGNMVIVTTTTLLQSMSPNYIRGRIMGLTSMLNTISSVSVYFMLWQLPDADRNITYVLWALAPVVVLVGLAGLLCQLPRGPLPTAISNVMWHVTRAFALVWHRLRWVGLHHVPAAGPVLLASNHTTGLDPFLIQSAVPRRVRWIMTSKYRFKAAEPLWRQANPIVLPDGAGSREQVRQIVDALRSGDIVGIFPEGGLQREQRQLAQFQAGVVVIARRAGTPIVPVWISGTPRRKSMLWHFLQPSRSRVAFGQPFTVQRQGSTDQALAELRARMQSLAPPGEPGPATAEASPVAAGLNTHSG